MIDLSDRVVSASIALALASAALASGCSGVDALRPRPESIPLESFRRDVEGLEARPVAVAASEMPDAVPTDDAASPAPATVPRDAEAASNPIPAPAPETGTAAAPAPDDWAVTPASIEPGEEIVVESLVGQVNGEPIYADDFFDPGLEAFLRQAAAEQTLSQFKLSAEQKIQEKLRAVLQNELFLAEARASLTPEQQQGLFELLRQTRGEVISREGGTRTGAEAEIEEATGLSLEQLVRERGEQELARYWYQMKIEPRVIVSWRDIVQEYERNKHIYNPPPQIVLAAMTFWTDREADTIETVRRRFAAGETFPEIAKSLGLWNEGEWQRFPLGEKGLDGLQLREELRTALKGLDAGEWAGPVTVGDSTWWLHVTRIEDSGGLDLYDPKTQVLLGRAMHEMRRQAEEHRYLQSLLNEGMYADMERMKQRLVNIAVNRYVR